MFFMSFITALNVWDAQTGEDLIGGLFDNHNSRFAQPWDGNKDSPIPAKNAAKGFHGDLSFC